MKTYFNKEEFNNALSFYETNPLLCKEKFEEYFLKYPKDYSAYSYYISVLINLGLFQEAHKLINELEKVINNNNVIHDVQKIIFIRNNLVFTKTKLLCYEENYQEAYNLLLKNKNIDIRTYEFLELYCRSKLGLLKEERRFNSYIFRQIIEYRENDFREHINKHLASGNINTTTPNENIFVEEFPIDKVIPEIKKHFTSDKALYPGFFEDIYTFKYNMCGKDNGKLVNYFKATVFHNTDNIITMFPTKDCEHLPFTDLNYLKFEEKEKVKTISQIDKFNNRFRKKY